MKYFGEKSLSSALSILFKIILYVVIVVSIIAAIFGLMFVFSSFFHETGVIGSEVKSEKLGRLLNLPAVVKMLFLTYFGVLVYLVIKIIKKSQLLFTNFKNNIVFDQSNVTNTSKIGMLMVWFAILTFDLGTLFVSLLLLMLCELFRNGAALQEEHDLTI